MGNKLKSKTSDTDTLERRRPEKAAGGDSVFLEFSLLLSLFQDKERRTNNSKKYD